MATPLPDEEMSAEAQASLDKFTPEFLQERLELAASGPTWTPEALERHYRQRSDS